MKKSIFFLVLVTLVTDISVLKDVSRYMIVVVCILGGWMDGYRDKYKDWMDGDSLVELGCD